MTVGRARSRAVGKRLTGAVLLALCGLVVVSGVAFGGPLQLQLWSGEWTSSTGAFGLRLETPTYGAQLIEQIGGTPCTGETEYFAGGYNDPGEAGKFRGCTEGGADTLVGRYQSDSNSNAGSFRIVLEDSLGNWKGTYTPDGGAPAAWSGSFKANFGGDGHDVFTGIQPAADAPAVSHLDWTWSNHLYRPRIGVLKNDASVRLCNTGVIYVRPYTNSPGTSPSFLPNDSAVLKRGQCVSFTVHNTSGKTIPILFFNYLEPIGQSVGVLWVRP